MASLDTASVAGEVSAPSASATVERIRDILLERLRPIMAPERPVVLLDFPQQGNIGDSAIWAGEVAALKALNARRVACDPWPGRLDPDRMRRTLPADTVLLLSGGGNFGDLWPNHQRHRERVLAELKHFPVVQLPQSYHFRGTETLDRAKRLIEEHGRVTLMARDTGSFELIQQHFQAPTLLAPDMAFALGPQPRPIQPVQEILWLSREDQEAPEGTRPSSPPGVGEHVDWIDETRSSAGRLGGIVHRLAGLGVRTPDHWRQAIGDQLARDRVDRGLRLLARGRIVVANRLHACLLSLLMGIPCFVSDTAQGKIGALLRTWMSPAEGPVVCSSEAEALLRGRQAVGLSTGN
jgi:exopolysaccharide biosynthesis predicted pyruvyltransferase EpsI